MHLQTPFLRDCFVTFWPRMIPFLKLVVIDTFHSYIVYCTVCCVYKVLQSWPGHLLLSVCAHVSWERMDFNGNTPSQGPLLQRIFTTCVCWKHVIIFLCNNWKKCFTGAVPFIRNVKVVQDTSHTARFSKLEIDYCKDILKDVLKMYIKSPPSKYLKAI